MDGHLKTRGEPAMVENHPAVPRSAIIENVPGRHSRFVRSTLIPASAQAVFDWHETPGAFQRLTPSWERVRVLSRQGGIQNGARVRLKIGRWPLALTWELEHQDYQSGRSFTDRQVTGPFTYWKHVHRMTPQGPDACVLEDAIEYGLPFGAIGRLLGEPLVRRRLEKLFAYRHAVTVDAFRRDA